MGSKTELMRILKRTGLLIVAMTCLFAVISQQKALCAEQLIIYTLFPGEMTNNETYPALRYFEALLDNKTDSGYEVKIFPGGQLGNEVEATRECQAGTTIHMVTISSGAFSSFYRKYQAVIQPYLFPDRLTAWAFLDSEFFANFMAELPSIGLRYLGTMDDGGGFVVLTNSLRPVKTPKDFEGMRVRTEENPAHMATMNAMGASAVPMAWGDVATALATKTAHAQFNAPSVVAWAKLWEIQKYVTFINHIYNTNTWLVSEKWFKSQTEENQKAILECAREAIIYSRGVAAHLSELAVEECKQHGMKVNYISSEDMTQFMKLAREGYRNWAVDEFGLEAELLDSVRNEVERTAQQLGETYYGLYAK